MSPDVYVQAAVTIVTTLFGFSRVSSKLERALQSKVDLDVYRAKVTELHHTINSEREKCAGLQAEVTMLKKLAHDHAA